MKSNESSSLAATSQNWHKRCPRIACGKSLQKNSQTSHPLIGRRKSTEDSIKEQECAGQDERLAPPELVRQLAPEQRAGHHAHEDHCGEKGLPRQVGESEICPASRFWIRPPGCTDLLPIGSEGRGTGCWGSWSPWSPPSSTGRSRSSRWSATTLPSLGSNFEPVSVPANLEFAEAQGVDGLGDSEGVVGDNPGGRSRHLKGGGRKRRGNTISIMTFALFSHLDLCSNPDVVVVDWVMARVGLAQGHDGLAVRGGGRTPRTLQVHASDAHGFPSGIIRGFIGSDWRRLWTRRRWRERYLETEKTLKGKISRNWEDFEGKDI